MRPSEKQALQFAVREAIHNDNCLKSIAADLGKPYFTLAHEIGAITDTDNNRHKLGAVTLVEMLDIADNPEPVVDWLAERYGFLLVREPDGNKSNADKLHETLTRVAKEVGDVAAVVLAITSKNSPGGQSVTDLEATDALREIREAHEALATAAQIIKSRNKT